MKCYVVHRKDNNNVGDIASDPMQYFLKPGQYETVDILDVGTTYFEDRPVIVGGGGLIANDFMGDKLFELVQASDKNQIVSLANEYWQKFSPSNKDVRDEFFKKLNDLVAKTIHKLDNKKTPRIIWGAGHNANFNKKDNNKFVYPPYLRNFDLIGIRDFGQQYHWVPCASCMHPALRKKYPIKNDVVWFEHKKQLVKSTDFGVEPVPRFVNSGGNIEQTIEILGTANIIITNSYHGAYWGALLGKKVMIYEPWSSKFNTLKHKPYVLGKGEEWRSVIDGLPYYTNALEECITRTQSYWEQVKEYL